MEKETVGVIIDQTHHNIIRDILQNRLLVVVTIIVMGCTREIPADPMCRISIQQPEMKPSAAACLIKTQGKLLAIKNSDDNWNLPTNKQQKSISAQCTAHAAVWKTTGLNIEVGKLLFTSSKQTQYFACELTDELSKALKSFSIPPWGKRQTSEISIIDPFETQQGQWTEDISLTDLRVAFNQLK